MAKRKQHEAYTVEPTPTVAEGREVSRGKEPSGSEKTVVTTQLQTSEATGKATGDPGAGSSTPVATAEEEQGVETFWSLLARAGYTTW